MTEEICSTIVYCIFFIATAAVIIYGIHDLSKEPKESPKIKLPEYNYIKFTEKTVIPDNKTSDHSTVDHPEHYNQGNIECIDALEEILTPEQFKGFLKGNAFKYLWREEEKSKITDIEKMKWYLDRWIEYEYAKINEDN